MQTNRELVVEPIGLDVDKLPKPLNWREVFGNDHPVEIEIGMGKGTFITEQAKARPEVNFFGLEYARWYWRYSSDRLRRNGCLNARAVRAEALFFLKESVPDASVSVLHIYFPDYNRPGSAGEGEFVGTNFERKYARDGRPFFALAAVKG